MDKHPMEIKRAQAFQALGQKYGMDYEEYGKKEFFAILKQLPFFRIGTQQQINNVLRTKTGETRFYLFDYTRLIVRKTEDNDLYEKFTLAFVFAEDLMYPTFSMVPETFMQNLMPFKLDINFKSYKAFSKKYYLTSSEETKTRALFTSEVLNFFGHNSNWQFHVTGPALVLAKKYIISDSLESFLKRSVEIFQLFDVWRSALPASFDRLT